MPQFKLLKDDLIGRISNAITFLLWLKINKDDRVHFTDMSNRLNYVL